MKLVNRLRFNPPKRTVFAISLVVACTIAAILLVRPFNGDEELSHMAFFHHGHDVSFYGETSMEEVIANSDVIVRTKFVSVEAKSKTIDFYSVGLLRYRFRALEYLLGEDQGDIYAEIEFSCPCWYSKNSAEEYAKSMIEVSTHWHGREMVIFLKKPKDGYGLSSGKENTYQFAGPDPIDQGRYLIDSTENKAWLPAAVDPSEAARTKSGDDQLFLIDWPSAFSGGAASSPPTIKLSEIKNRVNTITAEMTGYDTPEIGRRCVSLGYGLHRFKKSNIDTRELTTTEFDLLSGQSANTEFVRSAFGGGDDGTYSVYFLTGEVGKLFPSEIIDEATSLGDYELAFKNSRPIPSGKYASYLRMVPDFESAKKDPCFDVTALSNIEDLKAIQPLTSKDKWVIAVTAPEGTLHEAFFDPVALTNPSDGIGVRYNPKTSFTLPDKTSVTLDYLYYAPEIVKMGTTPHNALSGYEMDIIELDGKVSSTFAFGGSGSTSAPHEWATCVQPWEADDKLMLRIRKTGTGSASASAVTSCPN